MRRPPAPATAVADPGAVTTTTGSIAPICFDCHGDRANGNPAPPRSVKGSTTVTDVAVGAHQAHVRGGALRAGVACGECHVLPAPGDPFGHIGGKVATLTWGALARARGVDAASSSVTGSDGSPGLTCTNYCHGPSPSAGGENHAPSWTIVDGTQASCGSCHGVPPPSPHPTVTGGATACAACHPATVKADGTIDVAGGKHVDGAVEVAGEGCTSCHGDANRALVAGADANTQAAPPVGTHGETLATARAVGAHQAHLNKGAGALAAPIACTECHTVPANLNGHPTGTVVVAFGARARTGGATPVWNGSTCASTYCHGATLNAGGSLSTPSWTTVNGTQAACGTCHGIPPPQSSGHPAVVGGVSACNGCHPATVKADGTIDVAGGKHVNGTLDVSGVGCTACHGDATRAPAAIAPAPPIGTHGETLTSTRAVGAHQSHLVDGTIRSAVPCGECHVVPASLSGHPTGVVNVTFGPLATTGPTAPAWNGTACASTYCHGATLGAGGSANTPVWTTVDGTQRQCTSCHGAPPSVASGHPSAGSALTGCATCHPATVKADGTIDVAGGKHVNGTVEASTSCTSCHGDPNRTPAAIAAAPPKDTQGSTSSAAVGAHLPHLTGGAIRNAVACSDCHAVPPDASHATQILDLTWGALARTGAVTPSWVAGALTCTNYCHGVTLFGGSNTSPVWNAGSTQATCGTCHGLPPPRAVGASQHPPVPGGVTACSTCHPATVSSTGAIDTAGGKHIDGSVELDYASMTCTTCHGDSTRVLVAGADANAAAAPPVATHGESATSARAVGAHQAHLNRGTFATPVACAECHAVPTTMSHSNGTATVAFGTIASTQRSSPSLPSWDGSTCSNTWCHAVISASGSSSGGSIPAPTWTSGTMSCVTCHGNPPGTGHHGTHQSQQVACVRCHGTGYTNVFQATGTTTGTVNLATHVNGAKNVGGAGTSITTWAPPSCTPTCHGRQTW